MASGIIVKIGYNNGVLIPADEAWLAAEVMKHGAPVARGYQADSPWEFDKSVITAEQANIDIKDESDDETPAA